MTEITRDTTSTKIEGGEGDLELRPGSGQRVKVAEGMEVPPSAPSGASIKFDQTTDTGLLAPANTKLAMRADGVNVLQVYGNPSHTSYLEVSGANSFSTGPIISSDSAVETDVNIEFQPKGAGVVTINGTEVAKVGDAPSPHTHVKANITDFSDGDYATAAQGSLADSATQPGDNVSALTNDAGYLTSVGSITASQIDAEASIDGYVLTSDGAGSAVWEAISGGGSSPLTTKGDIYTYDTGDARLPVGTDGQVLTADSAEATGVKWADAAGGGGASTLGELTDVQTTTAPPSARYWRIAFTENGGDANLTGFEEIEFRGSIGGPDLTGSGTAIFGTQHGSFPAAAAFDGTAQSYFTASGSPFGYIGYDFGAGNDVSVVEYTIKPYAYEPRAPYAWTLEYSDDGVAYTVAATVTTEPDWSGLELRTYPGATAAGLQDGQLLAYDTNSSTWVPSTGGGGASSFIDLTDTPAAYSANWVVSVNSAGDGLTYTNPATLGSSHLVETFNGSTVSGTFGNDAFVVGDNINMGSLGNYQGMFANFGGTYNLNSGQSKFGCMLINTGGTPTMDGGRLSVSAGYDIDHKSDSERNVAFGNFISVEYDTNRSVALGENATIGNRGAIAIGYQSYAYNSSSTNGGTTAVGTECRATNNTAVAFGFNSEANHLGAVAIGSNITTTENYNVKLGASTNHINIEGQVGRVSIQGGTSRGWVAPGYADGAEPAGVEGQIIFDSTNKKLKFYNGTSWETVTSA